jgi:predicted  nucleic acid-binding Zn-ribbon protein
MHPQVKTLYQLQQLDKGIAALERELAGLDQGDAEASEAQRLRSALAELEDALAAVRTDRKDAELSLQTTEGELKKYRERLYGGTVANPKELEALEKEVSMLSKTRSKLDEKILSRMDTEDGRQRAANECSSQIAEVERVRAEKVAAYNARKAEIEAALAQTSKERDKVASTIDPDLLERYEDKRARLGNLGVAAIVDGACEGCHITVPEFQMRDFEESETLQTCQCGRILHLPEPGER